MTAQADLMERVTRMGTEVAALKRHLHSGAWQRMNDYADGPPTTRFDAAGFGSGISDPTARLALSRNRSMAAAHMDEFFAAMDDALAALGRAVRLAALYPERDPADLLILAKGDPGCESCARTQGPRGKRWEPIDPQLSGRTTVAGRLARPVYLCAWCYRRVLLWERLPTIEELELRHSGKRVPWPADVPRPKEKAS